MAWRFEISTKLAREMVEGAREIAAADMQSIGDRPQEDAERPAAAHETANASGDDPTDCAYAASAPPRAILSRDFIDERLRLAEEPHRIVPHHLANRFGA